MDTIKIFAVIFIIAAIITFLWLICYIAIQMAFQQREKERERQPVVYFYNDKGEAVAVNKRRHGA